MSALTASDIERVAGDCLDIDSQAWLRREHVAIEAMARMLDSALRGFHRAVAKDGDTDGALVDIAGQSFRLGWEARKAVQP